MEENTQLPKEIQNEIANKAAAYADQAHASDGDDIHIGYLDGATAYATKLHQADRDNSQLKYDKTVLEHRVDLKDAQLNNLRKSIDEAKNLLNEVFRKHEAGLDRFIYEKIKSFLYGE